MDSICFHLNTTEWYQQILVCYSFNNYETVLHFRSQNLNATQDPDSVSYTSHHLNIETSIKSFHVPITFLLNTNELIEVINRRYICSLYCYEAFQSRS